MPDSIVQRMKQEKWWIHLFLVFVSGVWTFTLLNMLLPLAMYNIIPKLLYIAIGFTIISFFTYQGYDRILRPCVPALQKYWVRNLLVTLGMTLLILSITPLHLPYHPVEHHIKVETNSPNFQTRWVNTSSFQYITAEEFTFTGNWSVVNSIATHTGDEPASFEFKHTELLRDHQTYSFGFMTDDQPASFTITIDGDAQAPVKFTPDMKTDGVFTYTLQAPLTPSTSRIWRWISLIFPLTNALSVFIFLFCGVTVLLRKQQSVLTHILHTVLLGVVFYLFWMTLAFQNDLVNAWTQRLIYPLFVIVAFLLIPFLVNKWVIKQPHLVTAILLAVLLISIGLRIYWVLMVPTAQVSDFGKFHDWALQLANHEPGLAIDRYANFTRTLSLLYRVFPTHVAVEVLNILLAAATSICLYWIGKVNQHARIGLLAAYWLAIYPVHISMTSIVNTDIPAAFLLVLSVLLISLYVHQQKLVYLVLSGLIFAFCLFLRGAMLIYLPGILILLFLQRKQKATYYLASSGLLLLVLLLTTSGLSAAIKQVKVTGLTINESRYLMWPLVNGTNIEKLGRNNPEDTQMVFSWQPEEINRNGFTVVSERIFSDPLGFYGLLKAKFEHLFANATYGADVAFLDENHEYRSFQTGWNAPIEAVREGYAQVSQYAYLSILLLALIAVLKTDQDQIALWLPPLVLLLCALGAYAFFEVQPRYSFPLIPFLILLAGMLFAHRKPEGDFQ